MSFWEFGGQPQPSTQAAGSARSINETQTKQTGSFRRIGGWTRMIFLALPVNRGGTQMIFLCDDQRWISPPQGEVKERGQDIP